MRECERCGEFYAPRKPWQRFCSVGCNSKARRWSSDRQRDWISGNWWRYFSKLQHATKERKALTPALLIEKLEEQGGRCALTGVKLTNIVLKGRRVWTNASIDRITPGGPYIRDNIQLVCVAVNGFRSAMSLEEYREWCRLVVNFRGLPNGKKARLRSRVPNLPRKARAEEKPGAKKRGAAGSHGSRTSAQGRREGRRPQEAAPRRRVKRTIKSSGKLAK